LVVTTAETVNVEIYAAKSRKLHKQQILIAYTQTKLQSARLQLTTLRNVGNIIVLEVQDLLGVLNDGGGIRGQDVFDGLGQAVIAKERTRLGTTEFGLVGKQQVLFG
jgi:hypothetical protein